MASHTIVVIYGVCFFLYASPRRGHLSWLCADETDDDLDERAPVKVISPPLTLPLPFAETHYGRKESYLVSPTDSLLDENFEEAFAAAVEMGSASNGVPTQVPGDDEDGDDYADIAKHEIVEVVGDDSECRRQLTAAH